ncbi:MAG: beta-eliminating lyase-related protein [Myxococcota bacterium]|nr:beta-eliminating lyase-related protein [Myxococcota bacterium]
MIDLRSDTVTRPTAAMREAMARAEVGDDVLGDDPTARALEEEVARITGKAAALFVPSGTMGNQLAIATQTRPGDDVIVGDGAHPVLHECGAGAALSGVQFSIAGRGGIYTPEQMEAVVHPRASWMPRTSLVAIENTHNTSGGRVWPQSQAQAVAERARALGFATHLDGARAWNASVATGIDVAMLCAPFDTVSVCFSKGLGAPAGSAFCGATNVVDEARRLRRRWGGAMRQVGVLAVAALHALAHHRARLAEDHSNARRLADKMSRVARVNVDRAAVETNIVNIDLEVPADIVAQAARAAGVALIATGPNRLRAVTHLDVSRADVDAAAGILAEVVARTAN